MKLESTDDVGDFLMVHIASAALGTALELGLFWRLAEKPASVERISQAYGIPFNRCRSWLELLVSLGLLERRGDSYAPSSTARTAILATYSQKTWAFLAWEARAQYLAGNDLTLHISHPTSVWVAQGLEKPNYVAQMAKNPERARRFTRMLYEIHRPLAEKLAETLDLTGVKRLMDLGGGSGVVSLALLRRHSQLTAVVVDIANVCDTGREIAAESPVARRITFHPADFLQDPLPTGFDMVLECDVGIYTEELFRRLHASLNAGGRLVILDWLTQPDRQLSFWRLSQAFISSLGTSELTNQASEEVQRLLVQVGFHHIRAETLESNAVIIHAHK